MALTEMEERAFRGFKAAPRNDRHLLPPESTASQALSRSANCFNELSAFVRQQHQANNYLLGDGILRQLSFSLPTTAEAFRCLIPLGQSRAENALVDDVIRIVSRHAQQKCNNQLCNKIFQHFARLQSYNISLIIYNVFLSYSKFGCTAQWSRCTAWRQ